MGKASRATSGRRVRLPKRSAPHRRAFRTGISLSRRSGRRGTRGAVHAISAAAVGASTRRLQPPPPSFPTRLARAFMRAVFFEVTLVIRFGGVDARGAFGGGGGP